MSHEQGHVSPFASQPSSTTRSEPAEWHRYLHAEGILVADEGEECGPWHHRVFLGEAAPLPPAPLDVERLRIALGNVIPMDSPMAEVVHLEMATKIAAEYHRLARLTAEPSE